MFSAEALVKVLGLFSQREPPAEPFKRSGLTKRDFFHLFPLAKCRKCRGRVRESGEKSSTYLRTAALQVRFLYLVILRIYFTLINFYKRKMCQNFSHSWIMKLSPNCSQRSDDPVIKKIKILFGWCFAGYWTSKGRFSCYSAWHHQRSLVYKRGFETAPGSGFLSILSCYIVFNSKGQIHFPSSVLIFSSRFFFQA